jgi:hypothetical protein
MRGLEATVCSIALLNRNNFRVGFKTKMGIYSIDTRGRKFYPGEKYRVSLCLGKICPDFLGDDPEKMEIGTCSYEIREIRNQKNEIVYP